MIPFWKNLFKKDSPRPDSTRQVPEMDLPLALWTGPADADCTVVRDPASVFGDGLDDATQTLAVPLLDQEPDNAGQSIETRQTEVASYTSVGTRRNQQDSVCFDGSDDRTVCVLCDGMGGLEGGELASALAAQGVTQHLMDTASEDIPTEMGRAALRVNGEVRQLRDGQGRPLEAGTTLTVVFIRDRQLYWSNVGDSHIYRWRAGELQQLNLDHNLGVRLDQMVQEGTLSPAEAQCHPQRAALTSYLGIPELSLIGGNRNPMELQPGDILVQCSDGLYRCLSDERLAQMLGQEQDLLALAKKLVDTALLVPGSHDNTTVVLTRIKG